MRAFAIYNPLQRNRRAAAWLLYYPENESFIGEIAGWAKPEDLPLEFSLVLEEGLREARGPWLKRWVENRVPPANRENIDQILDANACDEYYIPTLLGKCKGRSSLDDFLIEEVPADSYRTFNLNEHLESPVELGVQLRRARRAAGLTQTQLAETTGVQQAIVSRIESGKGNPTIETIEILARGCGRSVKIDLI